MKAMWKNAALVLLATLVSGSALAAGVVGTWKTIDDETKQPKALVQISESAGGELSGKIIKLFNKPEAVCDKCEGANKDKPVVGMNILWGLKKDGNSWTGGKILDPKSGKVYSAKMKLEGDNKLEVRGFIGMALLGRTQVWERN
ncbi:DUF2147 domain-containing protein [Craterilacuibacter sinensis]|uniref:DUF2147 domain-containing protein n=1 Tax=Craterilacuibacter sinensis TaxID=2686017 RepID=A0A845BH45_9NEIS|nr:DUF2147 domain-containing protein [Craterilacuibacter sinensis]MXR35442.1 DUF2147 domain-containing protein [Craterilacuibacter sinensis]